MSQEYRSSVSSLRVCLEIAHTRSALLRLTNTIATAASVNDALFGVETIERMFASNRYPKDHTDVFPVLVKLLFNFGYEDHSSLVALEACRVIQDFAENEDNRVKLGKAGACEVLVQTLQVFGADHTDIVQEACGALCNLVENDTCKVRCIMAGIQDALSACRDDTMKFEAMRAMGLDDI